MSTVEDLRNKLPEYSKDIKLNLQAVLSSNLLSPVQVYGVAIAVAAARKNVELKNALVNDAVMKGVPRETIDDAHAAAVLMSMNNVLYRFKHMMGSPGYSELPAKLRMNRLMNVASNKTDFELFSLAVSAVNACEACIKAHESVVIKSGMTMEAVHEAIRISSVIVATDVALAI